MEFKKKLKEYQKYINGEFNKINNKSLNQHSLYLNSAINYSFLSKGKRIRPILNIVFFEAFGGKKENIIKFSSAIEMIHTYSLIHDDLPAIDDDVLRRSRATSHIKFNEATAILTGDALLNQSYETSLSYLSENFSKNVLKACKYLADAAGKEGMIIGQIADVELAKKNETLENLEFINENKTGKLIKASIVTAGLIANQSDRIINLLEEYSDNIGIAFQLKDDLLEATVDEKTLGKSIDSDYRNEKNTYIKFMGIERTKEKLEILKTRSFQLLDDIDIENKFIYDLTEYIFNRRN
ncbi:polyprenyl synthetase family protein [Clostridiaceae bacterium HSG29]|nr:polyprenyl synthetase family protein [Clostridiaceae bacterium HSG29]